MPVRTLSRWPTNQASNVLARAGNDAPGAAPGTGENSGASGGGGSGGGGANAESTVKDMMNRLREELEQTGQLISHPF
jgi:hypothetical protein